MTFTHASYASALATLKARKSAAGTVSWDAGEGWRGEAFYCERRKRVVTTSVNPDGMRVV